MDKMHISGISGSDSAHIASKSNIIASPYSFPKESAIFNLHRIIRVTRKRTHYIFISLRKSPIWTP